jgi:hypothetical protein
MAEFARRCAEDGQPSGQAGSGSQEERQKLNQMCIQLYLAAEEKEDERELARIARGLEVAKAELENTGRAVGMQLASAAA